MKKLMVLVAVIFYAFSPKMQAQCIKGNCYTGYGEYVFPDGSKYAGDFVKGVIHGKGIYYFKNSDKYIGNWDNGDREGEGRYKTQKGHNYRGGFHKNKFHGKGVMKYPNGDEYDGNWKENFPSGEGTYSFKNGDKYVGTFARGKFNGFGIMYYSSGNRFEGNWRNNKKDGKGIFYYSDGASSPGEWSEGVRTSVEEEANLSLLRNCNQAYCDSGKGIYTYRDGSKYVGEFKNGEPEGNGTVYYNNGDRYVGGWKNHTPSGKGKMYYADGRIIGAVWSEGNPIKEFAPKNEKLSIPPINIDKNPSVKIWAVVVGVSSYEYMEQLNYSDDDAYRMYSFLKSPEGGAVPDSQIKILVDENATRNAILNAMKRILLKADENDVIILYFSGHGLLGSFLPVDYDGYNNRINHKEIIKILSKSMAKHKYIIGDACHAGNLMALKGGIDTTIQKLYRAYNNADPGLAVMLSSQGDENSLEDEGLRSGIFTYFYIEGLKGPADYNNDKVITIGELFNYIYDKVRDRTANTQTPILKGNFDRDMPVGVLR